METSSSPPSLRSFSSFSLLVRSSFYPTLHHHPPSIVASVLSSYATSATPKHPFLLLQHLRTRRRVVVLLLSFFPLVLFLPSSTSKPQLQSQQHEPISFLRILPISCPLRIVGKPGSFELRPLSPRRTQLERRIWRSWEPFARNSLERFCLLERLYCQ